MRFLLVFLAFWTTENPSLKQLRTYYYQAPNNSDAAKKMADLVKGIDNGDDAVLICYKGASMMFKAKHSFNPVSKLSNFKTGKKYIELSAKKEPSNAEIRFVRLAIQENLPSFLGYNENIKQDLAFLKTNVSKINDATLKLNIENYLKQRNASN